MFPVRAGSMKKETLWSIFLRSLTIQASFNFYRMQSLGFAFAMLPLARQERDPGRLADALTRHLQMFNTHPYLTAAVIGSVARIEEEGDAAAADHLKKAVMGPYAAIGDPFFWGALRPFSAVFAVILGVTGILLAPVAFFFLYNPAHAWVRGKGFIEGYRLGKSSIEFIRSLNLPAVAGRIRFLSLGLIAILSAIAVEMAYRPWAFLPEIPAKAVALVLIVLCFMGIRRGISSVKILYGVTLLCMALSM
jgi:PTS system mannose-specific IID component